MQKVGTLPIDLASHVSAIIDNKFLILYGGSNGLTFFDSIVRLDLENLKSTMMISQPENSTCKDFLRCGRVASSLVQTEDLIIIFGGCSAEGDHNDFLILPIEHLRNDDNFSEITSLIC